MSAPQPAQAATWLDGHWTVSHGGTGHLVLNPDRTYTSTCEAYPEYPDARCPAPSGTFLMGSGWVDFTGADGSVTHYRYGGDTFDWDSFIIKSTFTSRTSSPLTMTKGDNFSCTDDWIAAQGNPMVEYDAASNLLYLTGSHELLGTPPATASVAETAPKYFQKGRCENFAPVLHIDSLRDTSVPSTAGLWAPKVTVTVKDDAGAPAPDAQVTGLFPYADSANRTDSCVTVADGTCTLGSFTLPQDGTSTSFNAYLVTKRGSVWDGQAADLRLNDPSGLAPDSVLRVDNIKDTSLPAAEPGQWVPWIPQARITVTDNYGTLVPGASVDGTFTEAGLDGSCVTAADGTCSIGGSVVVGSMNSSHFAVSSITKTAMTWDGQATTIWTYAPYTMPTPTPTSTPTPTPTLVTHHIGDLDNATTSSRRNWQPRVTARVLDSSGTAVSGAVVSGTFTNHRGTVTCTTATNGTCTLGDFTLDRSTRSSVFTVTGVVKASSTYAPTTNSDTDGDSTGTTITVNRP